LKYPRLSTYASNREGEREGMGEGGKKGGGWGRGTEQRKKALAKTL